jgi:succinyl-CoA synthetase beta subunit
LWRAYIECDATLAEINPLVITSDNRLVALDGKMVLDDNALYRHKICRDAISMSKHRLVEARRHGLSFIKLDGNIGCMVTASLAMTTMDIISCLVANRLISWTSAVVQVQRKLRLHYVLSYLI